MSLVLPRDKKVRPTIDSLNRPNDVTFQFIPTMGCQGVGKKEGEKVRPICVSLFRNASLSDSDIGRLRRQAAATGDSGMAKLTNSLQNYKKLNERTI